MMFQVRELGSPVNQSNWMCGYEQTGYNPYGTNYSNSEPYSSSGYTSTYSFSSGGSTTPSSSSSYTPSSGSSSTPATSTPSPPASSSSYATTTSGFATSSGSFTTLSGGSASGSGSASPSSVYFYTMRPHYGFQADFVVTYPETLIVFKSDRYVTGRGFKLTYAKTVAFKSKGKRCFFCSIY